MLQKYNFFYKKQKFLALKNVKNKILFNYNTLLKIKRSKPLKSSPRNNYSTTPFKPLKSSKNRIHSNLFTLLGLWLFISH